MLGSVKKEIATFGAFSILIFAAVFAGVTIIDFYKSIDKNGPLFISASQRKLIKEMECFFNVKENSISIPKIRIEAPLVFLDTSEKQDFKKALDKGVVHYPESELPNKEGTTIFLGHSAPLGWPKIRYDWVFSNLNQLETRDLVYIIFNNCQYDYRVLGKYFLDKGEELPEDNLSRENGSNLILISCWPPGQDHRRIAILAEIIDK